MTRRLLFLNGLAILTIPIHHATAYGLQAMFYWADRYRPVTVPNFDLLGSPSYYISIIIRQLDTYSVPGFLFISGFFVAFMARGKNSKVTWKTIMPRVKVLIIPFVVWTVIRYVVLRRFPTSLDEILNPYHFIPLLIQFYLLAPFLVPLAKDRWKLLLGVAAFIHLSVQAIRYTNNIGVEFPGQDMLLVLIPRWIVIGQQPFWFPFGLVFGLHLKEFSQRLAQFKWQLLVAVVVFGVLSVVEYQVADFINGEAWIGPSFSGFSRNFYILAFLLYVLSLDKISPTMMKHFTALGTKSLGIYLANIPFIYVLAVLMYRLTPWVLGNQLLYQTALFAIGLGGPLLLMRLVQRSPLRGSYRYLFG